MEEHRDHLGRLAEAGVDSFVVKTAADSVERVVDQLRYYGETFKVENAADPLERKT